AWENTDCQNLYSGSGRDTLMVKRTSEAAAGEAGWSTGLTVRAEGAGTVANAGVVLPRLLADQVGVTAEFRGVVKSPTGACARRGKRRSRPWAVELRREKPAADFRISFDRSNSQFSDSSCRIRAAVSTGS